ncbi:hypothetical protein BS50DRAFT_279811 [Corynespora cassiicola Philippines]|uniref:Uncharacterized protein n=1 Tax=Corynespora cassiicola Philippines TaxID=1448308 RepID=A0A2T2P0T3_CORCC|nr:hypothetical protein BS50DRAFT_279811 [Corynespora cassiicola Philippines]
MLDRLVSASSHGQCQDRTGDLSNHLPRGKTSRIRLHKQLPDGKKVAWQGRRHVQDGCGYSRDLHGRFVQAYCGELCAERIRGRRRVCGEGPVMAEVHAAQRPVPRLVGTARRLLSEQPLEWRWKMRQRRHKIVVKRRRRFKKKIRLQIWMASERAKESEMRWFAD